jgi:hypothetical protein
MDENIPEMKKPVCNRSLTPQEQSAISRMKQKRTRLGSIFRASENADQDALELAIDASLERSEACDLIESNIMEATGATNSVAGIQFLSSLGKAIVPAKVKGKEMANHLNTITQSMHALAPQDEYEGQLVAQLVVLHEHAMDWLGRALRTERVDFANVYLNGASKLLTRHHETLDALLKYRRKGEQRVHVEHVHIHGGGQAIVGNVTTGGGSKP